MHYVTDTYTFDSHDHLSSTSSKSYTYDANGNCTAVTAGGNTTTLTYDYENRVTGITYPSLATNSFQYNGLGLRTRKVDSSGTVNYVCDGTTPASPVLADTNATYTPGLSERRGTTSKFLHSDALGTTRGITNTSQSATDGLLFDAFGMIVSRTGTTPTPFGFVGAAQYQADADSGLLLLGHRYYDPSIGRFISQDPIQDGDNWYAYCGNNPIVRKDPTGLLAPALLLGAGIAGPVALLAAVAVVTVWVIVADPGVRDWIGERWHSVRRWWDGLWRPNPPIRSGPSDEEIKRRLDEIDRLNPPRQDPPPGQGGTPPWKETDPRYLDPTQPNPDGQLQFPDSDGWGD